MDIRSESRSFCGKREWAAPHRASYHQPQHNFCDIPQLDFSPSDLSGYYCVCWKMNTIQLLYLINGVLCVVLYSNHLMWRNPELFLSECNFLLVSNVVKCMTRKRRSEYISQYIYRKISLTHEKETVEHQMGKMHLNKHRCSVWKNRNEYC